MSIAIYALCAVGLCLAQCIFSCTRSVNRCILPVSSSPALPVCPSCKCSQSFAENYRGPDAASLFWFGKPRVAMRIIQARLAPQQGMVSHSACCALAPLARLATSRKRQAGHAGGTPLFSCNVSLGTEHLFSWPRQVVYLENGLSIAGERMQVCSARQQKRLTPYPTGLPALCWLLMSRPLPHNHLKTSLLLPPTHPICSCAVQRVAKRGL